MSLADCPKCWDTICGCGYLYQTWTTDAIKEQIAMLQKVLDDRAEGAELLKQFIESVKR